jgi:hypothetical protein
LKEELKHHQDFLPMLPPGFCVLNPLYISWSFAYLCVCFLLLSVDYHSPSFFFLTIPVHIMEKQILWAPEIYILNNTEPWREIYMSFSSSILQFSEKDSDWPCLCQFSTLSESVGAMGPEGQVMFTWPVATRIIACGLSVGTQIC